jgi:anti-sigma regulatory factor (Ser/Thr protein kinase)
MTDELRSDPSTASDSAAAGPPHLRLELLSQPRLLAAARALVSNFAQRLGFNEIQCGQISLAVDEAICNIINHGYDKREDGRIWLSAWGNEPSEHNRETDHAMIRIMLEDEARQVDPATIRSRDLSDIRPGGLGVHLIRETMDSVLYEKRSEGGMRLTMTKSTTQKHPRSSHQTDRSAGSEQEAKP